MGTITHKAGRVAVGKAADVVIKNLDKDREKEILKLVDFMEKYMDGEKLDVDFDSVRKKIKDKDSALNKYINKDKLFISPGAEWPQFNWDPEGVLINYINHLL